MQKNIFQRGPGVPGKLKSLSVVPLYHHPPSGLAGAFAPVLIGSTVSPSIDDSGISIMDVLLTCVCPFPDIVVFKLFRAAQTPLTPPKIFGHTPPRLRY